MYILYTTNIKALRFISGEILGSVKNKGKLRFLTLKRLNNELEEVIETIEILNTPQLMKQIERSKKDVKAGRVCELSGADDLDSIWK
jgi:hypothetical protein